MTVDELRSTDTSPRSGEVVDQLVIMYTNHFSHMQLIELSPRCVVVMLIGDVNSTLDGELMIIGELLATAHPFVWDAGIARTVYEPERHGDNGLCYHIQSTYPVFISLSGSFDVFTSGMSPDRYDGVILLQKNNINSGGRRPFHEANNDADDQFINSVFGGDNQRLIGGTL